MQIGIIVNPDKPLVKSVIPELIGWLIKHKQKVWIAEENKIPEEALYGIKNLNYCKKFKDLVGNSDVILAIGGDGTLLKTSRVIGRAGVPIFGINLGGLGFLTEVALDKLYPALNKLLSSEYKIESRIVLEAKIGGKKLYGLNDMLITGTGSGRMLQFVVWVDGIYVSNFSADGIIFSTPTGSTAYSLAALGPILHPSTQAIVINLICPHTLGARPIVVNADSLIEVKCESEGSILVADGQEKILLNKDENVRIQKADYQIKLIKSGICDFYEILRTKLKWGGGKER